MAAEQLDPGALGVPGLRTLDVGDVIQVMWSHGTRASAHNYATQPAHHTHTAACRTAAGWERGEIKECNPEVRQRKPVIIYRVRYDDGEVCSLLFCKCHLHTLG